MKRAKDDRHFKVPGFATFSPHDVPVKKRDKGKKQMVSCEEIVEPQKGIHVRVKIYEHVIEDFSCGESAIKPRKKGNKLWNPGWGNIAQETTKFYQLSRQVHVDFVGSSLLYRFKPFHFKSPTLLLDYLYVINPLHKNSICNITLNINFHVRSTALPNKAFTFLSKCDSLETLRLNIYLAEALCYYSPFTYDPAAWTDTSRVQITDPGILARIKASETLKSIEGLKKFELAFVWPDEERFLFQYSKTVVEPSVEMMEFFEEMRELV